jgi:predicted RNase H-like HicB family nuclease
MVKQGRRPITLPHHKGDSLDELFGSLREGIQLYLEEDGFPKDHGAPLEAKSAVLSD